MMRQRRRMHPRLKLPWFSVTLMDETQWIRRRMRQSSMVLRVHCSACLRLLLQHHWSCVCQLLQFRCVRWMHRLCLAVFDFCVVLPCRCVAWLCDLWCLSLHAERSMREHPCEPVAEQSLSSSVAMRGGWVCAQDDSTAASLCS